MKDLDIQKSIEKKMTAVVALLAAIIEDSGMEEKRKVEIILSDVGLSPSEIARMVGKKPDTVIKTIKRLKK